MPNLSNRSSSGLIVHSQEPFNAEPPTDRLRASYLTAQRDFYVRSHGAIPTLDAATHRVRVDGRVETALSLTVAELRQRFPVRRVVATMQCAGNRRADMQRVRPVSGDPWAAGAIGTAEWSGVALADVLAAAGAATGADLHVAFESADSCELHGELFRFGVSIPIGKAMAAEVLLADQMNGEALAPAHGAPLRVVVPGYAGVRSPKWLCAITVQDSPSANPIQAADYQLFPADVTAETADPARGLTINAMPVNSAICEPAAHARLKPGPTPIRGYATASDRAVVRVDVSADGGRNWAQATIEHKPADRWSWFLWHLSLDLPPGEHELVVRAWDEAGQTQPARPDDTWNYKGYLSASWHRVMVQVD